MHSNQEAFFQGNDCQRFIVFYFCFVVAVKINFLHVGKELHNFLSPNKTQNDSYAFKK